MPASILAGTVIGAGVFSLPFVFNAAGLLTGFFYLAFLALIYIMVDLLYADVIVRTPGEHRFVGYSKIYLGSTGFWAAIFIGLFQAFFVLTVYLILAPSFSRLFIENNAIIHLLAFWLLGSIAILLNIKRVASIEFLITAGIIFIIFLTFILGAPGFIQRSINWQFDLSNLILVGPILFALAGRVALPEMMSYFKESKIPLGFFRKAVIWGMVVPALVYLLFVVGILGLSFPVAEDAVSGLVGQVSMPVLAAIGILGLLSLISSYIIIGFDTARILKYDLFVPDWLSKGLVVFVPPALYFLGFKSFIGMVTFLGGVFIPLGSIFVLLMWLKAKKKLAVPPVLVGKFIPKSIPILFLIFFIVLIYVILN